VSRLRARCPDCGTFTAVAVGPEYECHACGREFAAGLVRVPRAWGEGGEGIVEASNLPLPYPEVAVVEEDTLGDQTLALAAALPERPLILGGCCCSHVGAVEGLAARYDRLALLWVDAHGDLNTPESSPTGNLWGMPLRMILDSGAVQVEDTLLVGARNLDPPEVEHIEAIGLRTDPAELDDVLAGADGVYVAFDADSLEPSEISSFMPEPGGLTLDEAESLLRRAAGQAPILGAGFTALLPDPANVEPLGRLGSALWL
jgi:arginase family enzyme